MGLTRVEDWTARLYDTIEAHRDTPFQWGVFDCCQFAAECVKNQTGADVMPDVQYSNYEEAVAVIQAHGGLSKMVNDVLGGALLPLMASRGDVVMRHDEATDMMSLGICVGATAVFPGERRGVAYVPMTECICCWKVG